MKKIKIENKGLFKLLTWSELTDIEQINHKQNRSCKLTMPQHKKTAIFIRYNGSVFCLGEFNKIEFDNSYYSDIAIRIGVVYVDNTQKLLIDELTNWDGVTATDWGKGILIKVLKNHNCSLATYTNDYSTPLWFFSKPLV